MVLQQVADYHVIARSIAMRCDVAISQKVAAISKNVR